MASFKFHLKCLSSKCYPNLIFSFVWQRFPSPSKPGTLVILYCKSVPMSGLLSVIEDDEVLRGERRKGLAGLRNTV